MKSLINFDSLDIKSTTMQAKKELEEQIAERMKTNNKAFI